MPNDIYQTNPMSDSGDYVDEEVYPKLLNSCKNDMERMLFILLWESGRRITELVGGPLRRKHFEIDDYDNEKTWDGTYICIYCEGLKPKDIDWEHKKIFFWILKKNRGSDEIKKEPKDVSDYLLAELRSYIESNNIGLEDRIIPRTRQWADLFEKRITKENGIRTFSGRRIHSHMFRHTWNVRAARSSDNPEDIVLQKAYMEHGNINTTLAYLKFANGRQRKLIDKMANKNAS